MIDIDRKDWSVVTKSRGGTVSLLRNLSLVEAVGLHDSLDPWRGRVSGQMYPVSDGDLELREILGPEGWDGCTKAAAHSFPDMPEKTTESGPNVGRRYRSGSCAHCGYHRFEWLNTAD